MRLVDHRYEGVRGADSHMQRAPAHDDHGVVRGRRVREQYHRRAGLRESAGKIRHMCERHAANDLHADVQDDRRRPDL